MTLLHEGTRIGADGKRYAMDDEDMPTDPALYRRSSSDVVGVPSAGQVPMWDSVDGRLEWGAGGGEPIDAVLNGDPAGGSLAGTYPNPTLAVPVSAAESDQTVLAQRMYD